MINPNKLFINSYPPQKYPTIIHLWLKHSIISRGFLGDFYGIWDLNPIPIELQAATHQQPPSAAHGRIGQGTAGPGVWRICATPDVFFLEMVIFQFRCSLKLILGLKHQKNPRNRQGKCFKNPTNTGQSLSKIW